MSVGKGVVYRGLILEGTLSDFTEHNNGGTGIRIFRNGDKIYIVKVENRFMISRISDEYIWIISYEKSGDGFPNGSLRYESDIDLGEDLIYILENLMPILQ
jgi:hypothetical protein